MTNSKIEEIKMNNIRQMENLIIAELSNQQKKIVDKWHEKPFVKNVYGFSNHVFGGPDDKVTRVTEDYIPENTDKVEYHPKTIEHLSKNGYEISDPEKGLVRDHHGRDVSIGKALLRSKASKNLIDHTSLALQNHGKKKDNLKLKITYSRHPYDIGGMSTDRGWTSCMNMSDPGNLHKKIKDDLAHGTHVAYLHHENDPDLKHPIARISLKPYVSKSGKVIRPDPTYHGQGSAHFHKTVTKWAQKHFPLEKDSIYSIPEGMYTDSNVKLIGNPSPKSFKSLMDKTDYHPHRQHLIREFIKSYPDHAFKMLNEKGYHSNYIADNMDHFTREQKLKLLESPPKDRDVFPLSEFSNDLTTPEADRILKNNTDGTKLSGRTVGNLAQKSSMPEYLKHLDKFRALNRFEYFSRHDIPYHEKVKYFKGLDHKTKESIANRGHERHLSTLLDTEPNDEIRFLIARRGHKETLDKLVNDSNETVRSMAREKMEKLKNAKP